MTEVRGRRDMDMGEGGDETHHAPTAMATGMAMEMGTAVITTAADTASTDTLEPMERNKNGKPRRRAEALASNMGPGDRRSCVG
jgi:hypothetical protein